MGFMKSIGFMGLWGFMRFTGFLGLWCCIFFLGLEEFEGFTV